MLILTFDLDLKVVPKVTLGIVPDLYSCTFCIVYASNDKPRWQAQLDGDLLILTFNTLI